jgi:hypothetical protein
MESSPGAKALMVDMRPNMRAPLAFLSGNFPIFTGRDAIGK